jgi:tetratricopeptide (TPR) repeat protein
VRLALALALSACAAVREAPPPATPRVGEAAYAVSPSLPQRILEMRHAVVERVAESRRGASESTGLCLDDVERHLAAVDAIAGGGSTRELPSVPFALSSLADEATDCAGPLATLIERSEFSGSELWLARAFERRSALAPLVEERLAARDGRPPLTVARMTLEAAWGVLAANDVARAAALFRECERSFEALAVPYGEFRALLGIAAAAGHAREHAAALDAAERALAITRHHRDDSGWRASTASALRAVAAGVLANDAPRALELATEARDLDIAARGSEHPSIALDLEWRAVALRRLDRDEEAAVDLRRAIELRTAMVGSDHGSLYTARIELAHLELGRGNTAGAEQGFLWGRRISLARGERVLAGWAEIALAQLYGLDRPYPSVVGFDPEAALRALDRADALFAGDGVRERRGTISAAISRASILSRLGRVEEALASIERAIAIESDASLAVTRAELLAELARADHLAEFERAAAAIDTEPRATQLERARAHWLFANALRRAGDLARMRAELDAAGRALAASRVPDPELAARLAAFDAAYRE